jgi:hypothetical protein
VHPVFTGGGGFVFGLSLFYKSFNSKKKYVCVILIVLDCIVITLYCSIIFIALGV